VAGLLDSDPGMAALAHGAGAFTRSLGHAALSITPTAAGVRLDLIAEVDPGAAGSGAAAPVGERPVRFTITRADVALARASRSNAGAAFGLALERLAPLRGEALVSSNELRVIATSGG
jgi:hypothetical protein